MAKGKKPTERQIALMSAIAQTHHGAVLFGDFDANAKRVLYRMNVRGLVRIIGPTVSITNAGRSALGRVYQ